MTARVGERVEFYKDNAGEWRFRRVATNNEVVAQGEGYEHKTDAMTEAEKLFGRDLPWFEPGYDTAEGADASDWIEVTHG